MALAALGRVDDVDIEASGKFKYILIQLSVGDQTKYIVRGYSHCGYHADIYDEVTPALEKQGINCSCPGGGRIEHDKNAKTILVYGYSMGFGQADHSIAVKILQKKFPDYTSIKSSNEGY
ncbi:14 kDa phosphohistidine phosphatase [Strongylocentrotus purpuratus]|uniref:14 kDa phosphohistidine phosphatase n=1 Tax=Strongylocentrotus purpuratus TaxID=7668 RepID=A0A7M7RE46_STRPU|nr:14 kDa phosphohistidine phosphatase [Strongylocentrotus purpuratus]|eukprot:XP_783577.1 PREDICTED: 14 kDa phosphohistidine phosphatase [Strongylocentrotus purpuratus]